MTQQYTQRPFEDLAGLGPWFHRASSLIDAMATCHPENQVIYGTNCAATRRTPSTPADGSANAAVTVGKDSVPQRPHSRDEREVTNGVAAKSDDLGHQHSQRHKRQDQSSPEHRRFAWSDNHPRWGAHQRCDCQKRGGPLASGEPAHWDIVRIGPITRLRTYAKSAESGHGRQRDGGRIETPQPSGA